MRILIVGSGLAGSTFANLLAEEVDCEILVIDKKKHIGGNCYTYKDQITGIDIHNYGPHVFHTNDDDIWTYLNEFTNFNEYKHRGKVNSFNQIFSMPINLHTINQLYDATFTPKEAEEFIKKVAKEDCDRIGLVEPKNFEEYAISVVGNNMYHVFYRFYTEKQWGRKCKDLPMSIIKRLPVRFNYDDTYFNNAKYPLCIKYPFILGFNTNIPPSK